MKQWMLVVVICNIFFDEIFKLSFEKLSVVSLNLVTENFHGMYRI